MYTVALQECIDKMNLECLTPEVELEDIRITQSDADHRACGKHIYGKPGHEL